VQETVVSTLGGCSSIREINLPNSTRAGEQIVISSLAMAGTREDPTVLYRKVSVEERARGTLPNFPLRRPCNMNILKMLTELRKQRDQVDEVIVTLECLALGRGKRPRPAEVNGRSRNRV
jgi:hypothetical protein